MMKKINEMRELQKKKGKKGFSMIELIIVIAIMAILIALIGTQLIPYLNKSRENKDLTTLDACLTNFQSAAASAEVNLATGQTYTFDASNNKIVGTNVNNAMNTAFVQFAGYQVKDINGLFKSTAAGSGDVTIEVDANGALTAKKGTLIASAKKSGVNSK